MLKAQSLGWLIDHPPPEVKSLWGNALLPRRGLTLLHSASKQGKSMLALNLALAGAAGLPHYLGFPIESTFTTFVLQGEIHLRGVWERASQMIRTMGATLPSEAINRVIVNEERTLRLAQSEMWDEFREVVRWLRPDLVILDPFAHVLTEDENSNVIVGKILEKIAELRDDPGCAILLVHHDGKPSESTSSRQPRQRSRGADRLNADPDSILSLVPLRRPKGSGPLSRLEPVSRYGRSVDSFDVALNEDTLWFERATQEDTEDFDIAIASLVPPGGCSEQELLRAFNTVKGYSDGRLRQARSAFAEAVGQGILQVEHGVVRKKEE